MSHQHQMAMPKPVVLAVSAFALVCVGDAFQHAATRRTLLRAPVVPRVQQRAVVANPHDAAGFGGTGKSRITATLAASVAADVALSPSSGFAAGLEELAEWKQPTPTPTPTQRDAQGVKGRTEAEAYPPTPTLRECLSFALPALGIYAAPPLMSLIDAGFVGRASSIELAALGPASSISDSAALPLLFLSIAATNLVARSDARADGGGGGDGGASESARLVARTCLGLGALGGSILAALVYLNSGALSALYCGGGGGVLAPHCSTYVSIRALGLPAAVVAAVAQAVCIGVRDTKTPVAAVALAAGLNLLGDLVLVPGLGLGIAGAAWATAASQICAAGLLLRVLAKRGLLRGGGDAGVRSGVASTNGDGGSGGAMTPTTTRETMASILSFIPFLFVMAVKIGMHNSCAATAAALGGAPAAAHTAIYAVAMLCFTFGDVGSSLSQAFLPAFAGSAGGGSEEVDSLPSGKKGPRRSAAAPSFDVAAARPTIAQLLKCTLAISATVIGVSSALLTAFAGYITRDAAVLQQMRSALPLVVASLSLHGTAITLEGLLLAQQNFRGLTMTYSGLAASVAALLALVRTSGAGLLGVWWVYVWFMLTRVIAFSAFGGLWPSFRLAVPWRRRYPATAMATGVNT